MRLIRVKPHMCAFALACDEVRSAHWFDKSALLHRGIIPLIRIKSDPMFTVIELYKTDFKSVQAYFFTLRDMKRNLLLKGMKRTRTTHLKLCGSYDVIPGLFNEIFAILLAALLLLQFPPYLFYYNIIIAFKFTSPPKFVQVPARNERNYHIKGTRWCWCARD